MRSINPSEFRCDLQQMSAALNHALESEERAVVRDIQNSAARAILRSLLSTLDPTQKIVADVVAK